MGKCWYGFGNGVVWPERGPWPPVPAPPYDQRGWWADSIQAQILFYNPSDLAEVARGKKKSYEPQPYAVFNVNPFLYDPGYDYARGKMTSVGDCCFDRIRGILCLFERLADGEKSLVHAWKIRSTGTSAREGAFRFSFRLDQNFPNPCNPRTKVRFGVKEPCRVVLTVCDLAGRDVCTLVDEGRDAGEYTVPFDAKGLASGIYFLCIRMGDFRQAKKMVLMR